VSFLLLGPFHQHWSAEMFNIDKKENREEVFTNVLIMISAVSIVMIFGISIFAKDIVAVMASSEYIDAWKLVPIISMAYFFYGLAEYTQLGVLITRKTHFVAYSTTIAAIINLGLNFILIPKWGILGASISTVLSFYGRFLIVYKFSQKVYPLPYSWHRINTLAAFSGLVILGSIFLELDSLVLNICKNSAFALAYLGLIYRYWLNLRERGIVNDIIKKPKQAIKLLAKS
jgi:O-antigen/teichoic acid export membrane protein